MNKMLGKPDTLRTEAEARLDHESLTAPLPLSSEALLHELQVHQIELEMQNDELRRAQVALEESRDRYVDLYEFAPVGYLTLTREGMIAETNLTGASLLGVERKKLLKRRFAGFVMPEDSDRWLHHFMTVLQRDGRQSCELALRRADGAFFHARLNSLKSSDTLSSHELDESPRLHIDANTATMLRITLTDVSERKQAEEILTKSRDQLKTFIQKAPISIALFDLNMNYLATSGRWLAQYSRGYADLIGRNHYEVHPDVPAEWKVAHQQALAGATLENNEDMWIQGDGSKHWLRWAALPWADENEKIGGIIISAENITDTKRLEMEIADRRNEMEHLQKMHVAAQTVAAIAHELNQPLLAIASYSEAALMLMKAEKPNSDKIHKAIEGCKQQAHRAGQSIREMLEFLSIKEFPTEMFDLNKEIHDVLGAARLEHELQFDSALRLENELPLVLANRIHVQKVLLNLLHNGIEAMQEAGVSLPAITVIVCAQKDGSVAQVTIQDNGPGVRKEDLHKLFEPFFTTKTKGLGMGLAISRSLIEENGGQLWVDPQQGSGATFHLTLPFAT